MSKKQKLHPPLNPIQDITILDWDLTVSIKHTFSKHHYYAERCMWDADSDKNIKHGLKLRHSAEHPLAIATYHDNMAYIEAQLKAAYLKSNPNDAFRLKRFETAYLADNGHFLIQHFTVTINGTRCNKPIIIIYLPTDNFEAHRDYLIQHDDKNAMIETIRAALDAKNIRTYFFDDTIKNCMSATKLKNVKAYHVSTGDIFEATLIQSRSPSPLLFCCSKTKPAEHVIDTQCTRREHMKQFRMVYIQEQDSDDEGFTSTEPLVNMSSII